MGLAVVQVAMKNVGSRVAGWFLQSPGFQGVRSGRVGLQRQRPNTGGQTQCAVEATDGCRTQPAGAVLCSAVQVLTSGGRATTTAATGWWLSQDEEIRENGKHHEASERRVEMVSGN